MLGSDDNVLGRRTLRLYGELVARRESWAGKIVLGCGAGVSMSGIGAAASVAGGTSLLIDPDKVAAKKSMRKGGVDFVVATLDEALRVLKNEVRQGRPLGVGLVAQPEIALAEMMERGVLPDALVEFSETTVGRGEEATLQEMTSLGMLRLRLEVREGVVEPSEVLGMWLQERGWVAAELKAANPVELRTRDVLLLRVLPAEDGLRRRWVERISQYQQLGAGASRFIWLGEEERGSCTG